MTDTSAPKLCFDRLLPRNMRVPHRSQYQGPGRAPRAIPPINRQWPNGSTIQIAFKGGEVRHHSRAGTGPYRIWVAG